MARKTREELSNAAKERARATKERHSKYPFAELTCQRGDGRGMVRLESGDDWLYVLYRDNPFTESDGLWSTGIAIDDPKQLAEFIYALCARYNNLVEELNGIVERISVKSAGLAANVTERGK